MRLVAVAVGALLLALGVGPRAEAQPAAVPLPPATALFFAGADVWRSGASGYGGLLWSPDSLDAEGFTLKLLAGAGQYRYRAGVLGDVAANQTFGSLLPGWRFRWDKLEVTAFAGLDLQDHRLTPDDTFSPLRGLRAGMRAGADLWSEPADGFMVALNAWGTTIGRGYWTRAAAGWRIQDAVWLGPEVQALGDANYRELRAGVHVTGLRSGAWEWSAGFGLARDRDRQDGFYGRIGILTRR